MELNDDDVIVIVVDDNSSYNYETGIKVENIDIKEEPHDYDEDQYQALLQYASNYAIDIKKEDEENTEHQYQIEPGDYLEDEFQDNTNSDEDEYRPTSEQGSDYEMSDDEEDFKRVIKMPKPTTTGKDRRRAPDPSLWKSKVEELCNKNPKLRIDKDALIQELVNLMRSVQVPVIDFAEHILVKDRVYRCRVCDSISSTKGACERHYLAQHGPRYLICYACGGDFRSTTNLYKHEKRCAAPDAPMVLRARAAFVGKKARGRPFINQHHVSPAPKVENHEKSKHRFHCSLCPAAFKAKTSLISHERMHRAERPFQCHLCASAYTSKSVLTKHMWSHKTANFVCHHCGRAFKNKTALASHIFTHSVPRFACEECPRRFTYKAALQLHIHRKHRNLPLPCACQICPKRFGRMWALKDHMKKAHGMLLMTRTMFFKQLPVMSDTEISQAKVVLRSQAPIIHPSEMNIQVKPLSFQELPVIEQDKELDSSNTNAEDQYELIVEEEDDVNSVLQDNEEEIKIVVMDDHEISELDYEEIRKQYEAMDCQNNGDTILVIEKGKIKQFTQEQFKKIQETMSLQE